MNSANDEPGISPAQLRAARALLDWTREETATRCKVGLNTLARFEAEGKVPTRRTLAAILEVLHNEGIVFIADEEGEGIYRRSRMS